MGGRELKQIVIVDAEKKKTATVLFDPFLRRADFIIQNEVLDSNNIANPDFPKGGSLDERLERWGKQCFKHLRSCDVCGRKETYAPPLRSYDYDSFPDLRGRTVCKDCRKARYNEAIMQLMREEKESLLANFPKGAAIQVVDINLCMFPECNCGWNVKLRVKNMKALRPLKLNGINVQVNRRRHTVMIGGKSSQWPQLARICELAGGKMPGGYPPT